MEGRFSLPHFELYKLAREFADLPSHKAASACGKIRSSKSDATSSHFRYQ
jgi:hypothetical protein